MRNHGLSWLYMLNASALIAHEIDSAYWHEWDLFDLPGGIQLFVLLNLALVVVVLVGFRSLLLQRRSGLAFSWLLVGGGFLAVGIHSLFLLVGNPAFRLPASIALLGLILVLSVLQAVATVKARKLKTESLP